MSETDLSLKNPPIVEAILDIDCDMPPAFDLEAIEKSAKEAFETSYPKFRIELMQEHTIETNDPSEPKVSVRRIRKALQFMSGDEKQLVQVRGGGFSFNRLAPYGRLDDYLPEIERAWGIFGELSHPIAVRRINLRYINRILLFPDSARGNLELNDYLKLGPRLIDEDNMVLGSFLHQYTARDKGTSNLLNVILAAEPPFTNAYPVIFDITAIAESPHDSEPQNWVAINAKVAELRILKNRVFRNTLTDKCLKQFQ